jgi:hypothetical protein
VVLTSVNVPYVPTEGRRTSAVSFARELDNVQLSSSAHSSTVSIWPLNSHGTEPPKRLPPSQTSPRSVNLAKCERIDPVSSIFSKSVGLPSMLSSVGITILIERVRVKRKAYQLHKAPQLRGHSSRRTIPARSSLTSVPRSWFAPRSRCSRVQRGASALWRGIRFHRTLRSVVAAVAKAHSAQ